MPNPLPEVERKTIGRTNRGRPRCDWRSDRVSQTGNAEAEWSTYRALIAELWGIFRRRSPSRVNGMQSSDSSSRRAIRTRSRLGSRTLSGSFTSSTYVQFTLLGIRKFSSLLTDRTCDRHQHGSCGYKDDGCGYASKYASGTEGYSKPEQLCRCNLPFTHNKVLTVT